MAKISSQNVFPRHGCRGTERAHSYRMAWVWPLLPSVLLRRVSFLLRLLCALQSEGRSFLGHIKTQLGRRHWCVDLGPVYERLPNGCLSQHRRTEARSDGMRELESDHPWASTVDLQIYLEGFDKGERFVLDTLNREGRVLGASVRLE